MSDSPLTQVAERWLIEVIIGPCSGGRAEAVTLDLQGVLDERWPEVGAAVGLHLSASVEGGLIEAASQQVKAAESRLVEVERERDAWEVKWAAYGAGGARREGELERELEAAEARAEGYREAIQRLRDDVWELAGPAGPGRLDRFSLLERLDAALRPSSGENPQ
jgi:hypothetical protein